MVLGVYRTDTKYANCIVSAGTFRLQFQGNQRLRTHLCRLVDCSAVLYRTQYIPSINVFYRRVQAQEHLAIAYRIAGLVQLLHDPLRMKAHDNKRCTMHVLVTKTVDT